MVLLHAGYCFMCALVLHMPPLTGLLLLLTHLIRYQTDVHFLQSTCECRRFGDTYKWLLYGDDDTLFFNHALIPTLQDMDPDMPYFLTGAHRSCFEVWLHETAIQPDIPSLLLTLWLRDSHYTAGLVQLRAWVHMGTGPQGSAYADGMCHMHSVLCSIYPNHVACPPLKSS